MQELGCSANENSLERNLGEMQKKHFKHTNARYNTEDQLDDRNLRTWQLRDLLHVAGLTLLLRQYSNQRGKVRVNANPHKLYH